MDDESQTEKAVTGGTPAHNVETPLTPLPDVLGFYVIAQASDPQKVGLCWDNTSQMMFAVVRPGHESVDLASLGIPLLPQYVATKEGSAPPVNFGGFKSASISRG